MKLAGPGVAALAALLVVGCSSQASTPAHGKAGGEAAPGAAVARVDVRPTKQEIAALFDEWNDTLRTGGPNDMAILYADDGVLLPTVSNDVRSNRAEIADYFEHFLQLHPRGTINEQHIDVLDNNTAVNSGVYTFDLVKDGEPTFVVARYNFVYEKINGKWLIKSHHSSAMPEPVAARPAPLAEVLAGRAEMAPAAHGEEAPAAAAHGDAKDSGHGDSHGDSHGAAAKGLKGRSGGGH